MRLIFIYAVLIILLALMTSAQCQQTAEDWLKKGNDFLQKGFYDLAIECYDESIMLNPNYTYAWNNKCSALGFQDKFDEAVRACDEAIKLDPKLVLSMD